MKKILLFLMVFCALPVMTMNAQAVNTENVQTPLTYNFFTDFFNSLFGNSNKEQDNSSSNRTYDKGVKAEVKSDSDVAKSDVKNTAFACDSTDGSKCDNSTDYMSLGQINGIVIDKQMEGQDGGRLGTSDNPADEGDTVKVTLNVKNTGNSKTEQTIHVQDNTLSLDSFDYDPAGVVNISKNGETTPSSTAVLDDLVKTGIDITLKGGEYAVLEFDIKLAYTMPTAGEKDKFVHNTADACVMNLSKQSSAGADEYGFIHGHTTEDGTVIHDGEIKYTTPDTTYNLCNTDGADIYKENVPDVPGFNAGKYAVNKADGTDVVAPGDTVVYTYEVQNNTETAEVINVKDALNYQNLDNYMTFDSSEKLLYSDGTTVQNAGGADVTIGDGTATDGTTLTSGFNVNVLPLQTIRFTFTGIVKDPTVNPEANPLQQVLTNQGEVCTTDDKGAPTTDCENPEAQVYTDGDLSKVDIQKTGDPDPLLVEDPANPGTGKVTYTVTLNNFNDHLVTLNLSDKLGEDSTIVDAPLTINGIPASANTKFVDPTLATSKNLIDGGTGVEVQIDAGDQISFSYDAIVNPEGIYGTDPNFYGPTSGGSYYVQNFAYVCNQGEQPGADWAGVDACKEDGFTNVLPQSPDDPEPEPTPPSENLSIQKDMKPTDSTKEVVDRGSSVDITLRVQQTQMDAEGKFTHQAQILNVKDELLDQSFKGMDKTVSLSVANGSFVTSYSDETIATPTVQDLIDGKVYVKVNNAEEAIITFTASPVYNDDQALNENKWDTTGYLENQAVVSNEGGDSESAGADLPYDTVADVKVNKTVTDASGDNIAQPGEDLTYDIAYKNSGVAPIEVTLRDALDDSNFAPIDNETPISVTSSGTSTFTPDPAKLGNLRQADGYEHLVTNIEAGETVTVEFVLQASTNADNPAVVKNPGDLIVNHAYADFKDKDGNDVTEGDDADIDTLDEDGNKPEHNTDGTLLKDIDDSKADNDGIAQRGNNLTFNLDVQNSSFDTTGTKTNTVFWVQETYFDKNVDYKSAIANPVTLSASTPGAKFVTDYSGSTDANPVLKDLVGDNGDGTNADGSAVPGVYVSIPNKVMEIQPNTFATLTFDAKVFDEYKVGEDEITNIASITTETGGTQEDEANIPTEGFHKIEAKKEVTSVEDKDGATVAGPDFYVDATGATGSEGDTISYKITFANNGSLDFNANDVTIKDFESENFDTDADKAAGITVTIQEYDENGTADGAAITKTFADLKAGLVYDQVFESDHKLEVTYTLPLDSDLKNKDPEFPEGYQINNLARIAYNDPNHLTPPEDTTDITADVQAKDAGTDTPIYFKAIPGTVKIDESNISVLKTSEDTGVGADNDNQIDPGESAKYSIRITNNSKAAAEFKLNDELEAFNLLKYDDVITQNLLISDETIGTMGTTAPVNGTWAGNTTSGDLTTQSIPLGSLLRKDTDTWEDSNAFAHWITDAKADPSVIGGINFEIPAGHTILVQFDVVRDGTVSTSLVQKLRNIFDVRNYF